MEERQYLYDAFISYRHLPLDKAVAVRLQELLEGYRPPKEEIHAQRIKRIFRDQSELPTSGDLGADIHDALMQSRYLIVICSERTKESVWCREEIRQFKEAHHGRNDCILAVLVEGEPREAFPEELLHETCPVTHEDGTVSWEERTVEPLSADVRAKSIRQSLRLLKTEFLRIAAPLLGCRFDELYRRHERRRKKKLALSVGGGFVVLTCILAVVCAFAWRTYLSEKNYRMTLADSYTRQGAEYMEEGELQEALLYCARALTLEPESQTAAKVSAALLLEENRWPYLVKEETGAIVGKQAVKGQELSGAEAVFGSDGTGLLRDTLRGYEVWQEGQLQEVLPEQWGTFTGASPDGEFWTFCGENEITFYQVETKEESRIPRPQEINIFCDGYDLAYEPLPAAYRLPGGKAVAAYGGYMYLYEETDGSLEETVRIDLAEVFPQAAEQNLLDVEDFLWVSEDGSLAVVADGSGIAAFDTSNLMLTASCYRYHYLLNEVAIRKDGQAFALVFGNSYGLSYNIPGGYLEVMDRNGNTLFQTEVDREVPLEGAVFSESDPDKILAWGRNVLKFYDMDTGEEFAVPLKSQRIEAVLFDEESYCVVDHGDGKLGYYGLAEFSAVRSGEKEQTGETEQGGQIKEISVEGMSQAVQVQEDLLAARKSLYAFLLDGTGAELDKIELDYPVNGMKYSAEGRELYLYQKRSTYLYAVKVNEKNGSFDGLRTLDTRGNLITDLYEGENGLMAVTGTNQILFYPYGQEQPELTIQLCHSGVVQAIREAGNGCITVEIKTMESSPDSYRFETRTLTELWDMEARVYIAALESGEDAETGLSLPLPDKDVSAFLASLTCCVFDDAGNVTEKLPELKAEALGNWEGGLKLRSILKESDFGGGTEEGSQETAGDTIRLYALYEQYQSGPESGEEEAWFRECEDIWERLEKEEIAFTGVELDLWFSMYKNQAEAFGRLEQIGDEVRIYLEISIEGELYEEDWNSFYDLYLVDLMTKTTQYDRVIADGFLRLAAGLKEEIRTEDELYVVYLYTAYWLDAYARLLGGEENDVFEEYIAARNTGSFQDVDTADMDALLALWLGQSGEAAEIKANKFEYEKSIGLEDEDIIYYERFYLMQYYVLEKRGILSAEIMNEYMTLVPMDVGIRIEEISAEAQSTGLRLGDLIVAVDGTYILGVQHAHDLFGEGNVLTLKIIRDGRIIYVEKTESAPFNGSLDLVIRKRGE